MDTWDDSMVVLGPPFSVTSYLLMFPSPSAPPASSILLPHICFGLKLLQLPWACRGQCHLQLSLTGALLFQEVPKGQSEEDMVGRPLPHLAAALQASGEAVYCDDIPCYENELFLRLVTSTRAHAKIKCV